MVGSGEGAAKAAPAWERWVKVGCVLALAGILVGGLARVSLYALVFATFRQNPTMPLAPWIEPTRAVLGQLDRALRPGLVLALVLVIVRLLSRSLRSSDSMRLVGALALGLIAVAVRAAAARLGHPYLGTTAAVAVASFLPFIVVRGAVARWIAALLAVALAGLSAPNALKVGKEPGIGFAILIAAGIGLMVLQGLLAFWGVVAMVLLVGWPTSSGSVEQRIERTL